MPTARGYDARACQNRQPVLFHRHPGPRGGGEGRIYIYLTKLSRYAWIQSVKSENICSSDNATLDRTHKTLHNIPERYVFGQKHAGPDTDQDAFHGKFHQHSRMRNRGNRSVNSTGNPFL